MTIEYCESSKDCKTVAGCSPSAAGTAVVRVAQLSQSTSQPCSIRSSN